MSNVIQMSGYTRLDVDPDKVLDGAKDQLSSVLVIGYEHDGGGLYLAASSGKKSEILLMLERVKFNLLNGDYDE